MGCQGCLRSIGWFVLGAAVLVRYQPQIQSVAWRLVIPYVRFTLPPACKDRLGAKVPSNITDLKVIFPSVGQTGTSSVVQALRDMGLRAVHTDETMVYIPEIGHDRVDPPAYANAINRCEVEAVSLEPHVDALPTVLQVSPNAKVIMTWRSYPSWRKSTLEGGRTKDKRWGDIRTKLFWSLRVLPYFYIWNTLTGQFSHTLAQGEFFAGAGQTTPLHYFLVQSTAQYHSPKHNTLNRGVFKIMAQEEAYLAHLNEIRQLVPKERLFEFDIKQHGWAEIESFLGIPGPPQGTPFPHPRSKHLWTNDQMFETNPLVAFSYCSVCFALHIFHVAVISSFMWTLWRLIWSLWRLMCQCGCKLRSLFLFGAGEKGS